MYTLGGGVDPQRGWGHRDETWHAMAELARYGVQPDWFELGDRDLATHLVRTQMLHAGYPLSQITTALCDRWQPGARLLPASDDRCETHAVITDPADDSRRAIHFQEWWVRYRAQLATHSFAFVGAEKASATTEAVQAITDADVIMLAPSNPVVSVGAVLAVPGIRAALRAAAGPVVGYSPIIGGKPLRGMADKCLSVIGVDSTAEAVGGHYGSRRGHRDPRLLAGQRGRPRRDRRGRGAVDTAVDERPEGDRRDGQRAGWSLRAWQRDGLTEHGTAAAIEILPVTGLPEFRPGDDLSAAVAVAAPWLRDGDVVVVTSKVVSKCEGRLVPAPEDPEARDELRRKLVDDEAVRVLARKGRTLITENRFGLIQAAAGVDGSNVGRAELALLPVDPDASAAALRAGLRDRLGVTVAVVITDTMGRAWRNGQTDAAVGAAGLAVLHGYAGARRPTRQRVGGHRDRGRRRGGRGSRSGQGQIDRDAGGRRARAVGHRRRLDGAATAAPRRGRPVLARHRRSPRSRAAGRPSCCAGRCAASPTSRCRRTWSRPRWPRRSPRRPRITPGRCASSGCRPRPPGPDCWTA